MKTSCLFLVLLLSLSFNSTIHANNICRSFFSFSDLSISHLQARQAIKDSDFKTLMRLIENNEINLQWKHPFNKSTLLHLAARYSKDSDIIETLATGIDVTSQDSKGNTAFHVAVASNNIIALEVLLEFNNSLAIQNKDGNTALHLAIQNLNAAAVKALVTQIDKQDKITEIFTITNKHVETSYYYTDSQLRIPSYFNPEKLPQEQKNALKEITSIIESTRSEDKKMKKAILDSDLQTMERLIERKKIDFQTIDSNSYLPTLLHLAAKYSKDPRIIKALVKAGVGLNIGNFSRSTELHTAAQFNNGPAIRVIVAAGGDLTLKDKRGEPALHTAIRFNNELAIKAIAEAGGNLTITDKEGNTALHLAAELNNEYLVRLLMQYKSSLSLVQNKRGETALHLAVRTKSLNLVKILLQHENSFLAIQNEDGDTAFHLAIDNQLISISEALLEAKAPLHIKNNEGKTPLDSLEKWKDMSELYQKALNQEL